MELADWADEVGNAFKESCGDRGRFSAIYASPAGFLEVEYIAALRLALGELMPRAALEIWVDGHSRVNVQKHLN